MNQPHVMANIMTASVSQLEFIKRLKKEIGHKRKGGTPYASFLCLNSGSEAMSLASRLADINTKTLTDPGARYDGAAVHGLTLAGSFHGRTDRPAHFSDSCAKTYEKHLASYRDNDYLLKVEPNNIESLETVFSDAASQGIFIEAFFMEPVMGEGNPGMPIAPEFYARARERFEDLDQPDMESYSKALNAGQYPLSVLALSADVAASYRHGLYGNTMTSNPRALDVAISVMDSFSDSRRDNIRIRGKELVDGMTALIDETDGGITSAQGTGLLVSCALAPRFKTYGSNSTEDYLRRHGLGVIHGGERSLRFTPVFDITAKEVELILALTKDAILNGPVA
jgi:acetylornithine/succinyldiaminopimelate/putrescine aminotransferase